MKDVKYKLSFILESILSLTDRLTGPFNVEAIIPQLDITISNGIMNFQEAGPRVSELEDSEDLLQNDLQLIKSFFR